MIDLEILRAGDGAPILLLHGFRPFSPGAPFIEILARRCAVTAPSHPGFGKSPRPELVETVYDLVHVYLAMLDAWPPGAVSLVGCSFGGWLAAEIACVASHRLRCLILVDPVGIKVSDRETPDILDIFSAPPALVRRAEWHDAASAPDPGSLPDEALVALARDRDALCRYAWHPYLHNPRLHHWLHRLAVPALVLWGESDRIVSPAYGAAYTRLIPGARMEVITGAGHHPELEQPERCAEAIAAFLSARDTD